MADPYQNPDPEGRFSRGGIPWEQPPHSSHIWGFRLYDAAEHGLGQSQLFVRFKTKGGAGIGAEYMYYLGVEEGRAVFAAMRASPHPYGEVLRPRVILAGNKGQKVA